MRRRGRPSAPAGGYALVLALVVLLILILVSALLATTLIHRFSLFRLEARTVRLTALLDAGLAETLARLAADPEYDGHDPEPFSDGSIQVAVDKAGPDRVRVEVRAAYWGGRRAARALVRVSGSRPRVLSWEQVPF